MIFNKKKYEIRLNELFRYEKKTNSYIIDISIGQYESLYSDLDFSPVKNRDLDEELIIYLENAIEDIPIKYNLFININMSKNLYNEEKESRGIKEIKHYFLYLHRKKKREINEFYNSAMVSFILGALFIFLVFSIKKYFTISGVTWAVILEGLNIGGWVFLWEFFSLIFLQPNREKKKLEQYQRIIESEIGYTYHNK